MSSSSTRLWWTASCCFVGGAVSALVAVRWFEYSSHRRPRGDFSDTNESNDTTTTTPSVPSKPSSSAVMDSPDLNLRLLRKAEGIIQQRCSSHKIVLVIERCTNDHNYSAILRTAEALGIQTIYMIDPKNIESMKELEKDDDDDDEEEEEENKQDDNQATQPSNSSTNKPKKQQQQQQQGPRLTVQEQQQRKLHRLFAKNAQEHLTLRDFATTQECFDHLKQHDYQIWTTDLSQQAVCFTRQALQDHQQQIKNNNMSSTPERQQVWPIPDKLAVVFGTESVGVSQYVLDHCDLRIYLPLRGFADSLNLSVATALIMHQLLLFNPSLIGSISNEEKHELRKLWYPKMVQQRLLTPKQKKRRKKLLAMMEQCRLLQAQLDAGELVADQLDPSQHQKLANYPSYQDELQKLETDTKYKDAMSLVQDFIDAAQKRDNGEIPTDDTSAALVQPLMDLRRADPHRVTFVGKNTKKMHQNHWKDMVAVTKFSTNESTSDTTSFFRNRAKQQT